MLKWDNMSEGAKHECHRPAFLLGRMEGGMGLDGAREHNELQLHNMCLKVYRPDQGSYGVSHPVPPAATMHAQRQ